MSSTISTRHSAAAQWDPFKKNDGGKLNLDEGQFKAQTSNVRGNADWVKSEMVMTVRGQSAGAGASVAESRYVNMDTNLNTFAVKLGDRLTQITGMADLGEEVWIRYKTDGQSQIEKVSGNLAQQIRQRDQSIAKLETTFIANTDCGVITQQEQNELRQLLSSIKDLQAQVMKGIDQQTGLSQRLARPASGEVGAEPPPIKAPVESESGGSTSPTPGNGSTPPGNDGTSTVITLPRLPQAPVINLPPLPQPPVINVPKPSGPPVFNLPEFPQPPVINIPAPPAPPVINLPEFPQPPVINVPRPPAPPVFTVPIPVISTPPPPPIPDVQITVTVNGQPVQPPPPPPPPPPLQTPPPPPPPPPPLPPPPPPPPLPPPPSAPAPPRRPW